MSLILRFVLYACFLLKGIVSSSQIYSLEKEDAPLSKIVQKFEASQIECVLSCERNEHCSKSGIVKDPDNGKSVCLLFEEHAVGDSKKDTHSSFVTITSASKVPSPEETTDCSACTDWTACCGGIKARNCSTPSLCNLTEPCTMNYETKIFVGSQRKCLQPKGMDLCAFTGSKKLSLAKNCDPSASDFIFDPANGRIIHVCSKKRVCVENNELYISSNCQSAYRFLRIKDDALKYSAHCVDETLTVGEDCNTKFHFDSIPMGPVRVSIFDKGSSSSIESFITSDRKPRRLDHFKTYQDDIYNRYVAQLTSYFVAPLSGAYIFRLVCTGKCKVYIPTESKEKIVEKSNTGTANVIMIADKKYFLKAILCPTQGLKNSLQLSVTFPDGTSQNPIEADHLCDSDN